MKKRIVIFSIIALVAVVGLVFAINMAGSANAASKDNMAVTELKYTSLVKSISVSGSVGSTNSKNVYSTQSNIVKDVLVKTGDTVKAGDVLAILDTESLELDLASQKASLESTEKTSDTDIDTKKRTYDNAKEKYDSDVAQKKRTYDNLVYQFENGLNSELINAQSSVTSTKLDLDSKQKSYDDNVILFEVGDVTEQTLTQSKTSLENAKLSYEKALASLEATKNKVNEDIETARKNYESSQMTARQEIQNAEKSYQNALSNATSTTQEISVQKLEKQIKDSTIVSPIDGMVTAVYAKEGSAGNGLLFIVEDTNNLEIVTNVKEYDVGDVKPGQKAIIKSDATGDRAIAGEVTSIAPTSNKNTSGQTISASVVEFETIVKVTGADSGLKVGMNTRLNIILQQKDNIFALPYDSIIETNDGEVYVFIAESKMVDGTQKYFAKKYNVELGIETDFYLEIIGDELTEGVKVITNPENVTDGMEIKI